jgi:hypothetical protein
MSRLRTKLVVAAVLSVAALAVAGCGSTVAGTTGPNAAVTAA